MKKLFLVFSLLSGLSSYAQDVSFARKMVDTLASPYFWGRGYTKDGMTKAADFLAVQYKTYGLLPLNNRSYFQRFSYPVNTFPGKMQLAVNGKKLQPGKDYIVTANSRGYRGTAELQQKDSTHFINTRDKVLVAVKDKLTWSVAARQADLTSIEIIKKALDGLPKVVQADIENKEIEDFRSANIGGWVKGTERPDSFIVIAAHYDHLGGMGLHTYFPGANDNASGTTLLLGLANYYAAHPPRYSIAFICFAGEEAGLRGSKHFTENPLIPLKSIRFLVNLDLEGTGDEGITVVNASEFPTEFTILNAINDSAKYLVKINARGKAPNSDHYWFSEKGVPAFFLYTVGGIKAYHDVFDRAETLPLNEYEDLFKLISSFNQRLMK